MRTYGGTAYYIKYMHPCVRLVFTTCTFVHTFGIHKACVFRMRVAFLSPYTIHIRVHLHVCCL